MNRVIINSDDFASDKEVNQSILSSFSQKLISSSTALVNFSEGLEDAVQMVKANQIPKDALGLHLNLTSGVPVLEETKSCGLICENGLFHGRIRTKPQFHIKLKDRQLIFNELEAQLHKFNSQFGFMPSHIDGHEHVHTEWAIMRCVNQLANENKITKIRIARNLGENTSALKSRYKSFFNWRLRQLGFITTDFFGDFSDIEINNTHYTGKTVEIMVHAIPSINDDIVNDYNNVPLKDKVEKFRRNNNFDMINYSQL
tara:strand:+ start:8063 stop:8833 length:771 start_codon:yes stop_codon:yes gene_type:complete